MKWIILAVASASEVSWAIAMKYSDGFTRILPTIWVLVGSVLSVFFLSIAVKQLPLGMSYAIWTGVGTVGTTVLGIFLFKEMITVPQAICLALIIVGVVGLRLVTE